MVLYNPKNVSSNKRVGVEAIQSRNVKLLQLVLLPTLSRHS